MSRISKISGVLVAALFAVMWVAPAQAQATRTWVSGVGDDVNPCSRTAPCKTFAGAMSKTAAGGEINCLDPAGFGAVTINKGMAIICDVSDAGVLVSAGNGMNINAGSGDNVIIKGLDFEGLNSSANGIQFNTGRSLHVANCVIRGFGSSGTQAGIAFLPTTTASLSVQDSVITDNNYAGAAGGILVKPGAGINATASIRNTMLDGNVYGLRAEDRSKVTVQGGEANSNTSNGYVSFSNGAAVEVSIVGSSASNNGASGIVTSGGAATVRLQNVMIVDNATGINISGGSAVGTTPGTTTNAGNTTLNGVPGSTTTLQ